VTRRIGRLALVGLVAGGGALAALACREDLTAPGKCPAFCPRTPIGLVDTVLTTVVVRDSAFGRPQGYLSAGQSGVLIAANLPGVDSRPIIKFDSIVSRQRWGQGTDTSTGLVLQPDSVFVRIVVVTRDTAAHNLRLQFYGLPLTIDSTTTFADLVTPFGAAALRSINLDSLLAIPADSDTVAGVFYPAAHRNPATGDAAIEDSAFGGLHRFTVYAKFDSTQIPYVAADSGRVALGVRVNADSPTMVRLAASRSGASSGITWYSKVDSLGTPVFRVRQSAPALFDSFVSDATPAPLDSNLAVGGLPATRSVLRFDVPRAIRDSSQIVRATLVLVPAVAAQGVVSDSFRLFVNQVAADFGAKSPLSGVTPDSATVRIGVTDTVSIELTKILRLWQSDSTVPRALVLRQRSLVPITSSQVDLREGASFSEIRFYSSRAAAFSPALHLTYVPRYPFGAP
jgi:hypothetical protein